MRETIHMQPSPPSLKCWNLEGTRKPSKASKLPSWGILKAPGYPLLLVLFPHFLITLLYHTCHQNSLPWLLKALGTIYRVYIQSLYVCIWDLWIKDYIFAGLFRGGNFKIKTQLTTRHPIESETKNKRFCTLNTNSIILIG